MSKTGTATETETPVIGVNFWHTVGGFLRGSIPETPVIGVNLRHTVGRTPVGFDSGEKRRTHTLPQELPTRAVDCEASPPRLSTHITLATR